MLKLLTSCAAVAALSGLCNAQAFNIDVGTASPTPTNAFGAGSGQTGFWNTFANVPLPNMLNTAGSVTGVSMSGTAGGTLGAFNDPGTFGNDEALMDDFISIPFLESYTITGLSAGSYNVYTYVWTVSILPVDIQVNGGGYQTVGGPWSGSYIAGQNYSLLNVSLGASQPLVLDFHTVNGAIGGLTGIQIVPVPGPGAAGVFAVAGLLGLRRRRA